MKILLSLIYLFLSLCVDAQDVPTVSCSYCGGTGHAGYVACYMCMGSGRMVDPNYANRQAYEYGKKLMKQAQEKAENSNANALIYNGACAIVKGNYGIALSKFEKAAIELGDASAHFYLGAMYELGMGISVDRNLAEVCYNIGSEKNDRECIKALARISQSGYWSATESMRTRFRNLISNMLNRTNAIANSIIFQDAVNNSNSSNSSSRCRICNGSGVCTSCGGKGGEWRDIGYYTGSGNKSWRGCPSCKGTKQCFNCRGTGK